MRLENRMIPLQTGMPQAQLPIFAVGLTAINQVLAYERREGRITYFTGALPVFMHDETDRATFQMITSQFVVNGNATQAEISRAFGVPKVTIKRSVARYRESGPRGFYQARNTRSATVLTPPVITQVQSMLDEGNEPGEIGEALGIKTNTLMKAIAAGKLHHSAKKKSGSSGVDDPDGRVEERAECGR